MEALGSLLADHVFQPPLWTQASCVLAVRPAWGHACLAYSSSFHGGGALAPEDDGALQLCPSLFGVDLQSAPVTPFSRGQARREGSMLSLQPSAKRRACLTGTWPWGALSLVPAGHLRTLHLHPPDPCVCSPSAVPWRRGEGCYFLAPPKIPTPSLEGVSPINILFEVGLTQGHPRLGRDGDKGGHTEARSHGPPITEVFFPTLHHAACAGLLSHTYKVLDLSRGARQDNLTDTELPKLPGPSVPFLPNPTQWNEGRTRGIKEQHILDSGVRKINQVSNPDPTTIEV